MKKTAISLLLIFALTLSLTGSALAAFQDFTDVQGHWAEQYLSRAYSDGLVQGVETDKMAPDKKITQGEILAILCRVLGTVKSGDVTSIGLYGNEWYANAAGQALHMGLISPQTTKLTSEPTRLEAFKLLSNAFQLSKAEPDYSGARMYSDFLFLSSEDARIIASMVEDGYIVGSGGTLMLSSKISRAEFVTVLYRVIGSLVSSSAVNIVSGNALVSEDLTLSGASLNGDIWLGASANSLDLNNVTANRLTIRSESLDSSAIRGSKIDRLVFANTTGDLSFTPDRSSKIGALVVGDGRGHVELGGTPGSIEIVGTDRDVKITAKAPEIFIYGSNNSVVIEAGYGVEKINIGGKGNTVVVNGSVKELKVSGSGNSVSGSGRAGVLTVTSYNSKVTLSSGSYVDKRDPGISELSLELNAPSTLPLKTELYVSATVSDIEDELPCTGSWYLDGKLIKTEDVVAHDGTVSDFKYRFEYSRYMKTKSAVKFVLEYTDEAGELQSREASASVYIENYSDEYYQQYEVQNVLNTVTSRYAGNYTTQWALDHDYDRQTKTIWMNAKGYSSSSQYIIWINLTYQRVNIFQGSRGNWTLIHEYLCGSGAYERTPRGTFTVFGKSAAGWTTATYNCRPVVNFKTGSGYAFHSRLYDPTHSYLTDPSIGFPVSHGCIRMYDADVQWMYNNIPIGTTVVVY